MYVNIRSIFKHISDLKYLYTALNNDNHIIITTESWISNNLNVNFLPFKNFQIVPSNNNICRSNEILVFIKN